ncbi:MAG: AAA family ATPase [Anaerolineales bacterium]|nr:AAA family ATPase [Anaerolineales bacterium]
MTEMVNPYIAGAPVVETRMFFGREDVFDWTQNSLTGQYADHTLVIHGQRRVGKTSVLKQLGNRLPEKYIPVFFDLQGRTHTTLDRFLWWLAREIVRVLKQERGIEIPVPEKEDFTADLEYFENKFLSGLRPILGDNTLLLTFDEFDNLEESEVKKELARPLVDYLRRLMGEAGMSFIFSIGSSGRKLENMQASYTEFFKTALYKKISFLSRDQTSHLVAKPVEGVLEYERPAVDMIFETAFGHPYFTQLMCHELFARCQRTEQRKIAKVDVESVLDSPGLFYAIAFSPNTVFASGMVGTTFYVSQDGGYTWIERTNGLGAFAFNLHVPRRSDGPWYIDGEGGIFRTTDEGKTWTLIDKQSYYLAGENGDTLYRMGGVYNLLRSRDGGETWQSMALPPPNASGIGVSGIGTICQQTNTVFALFPDGYYLSTDGGETWDSSSVNAWAQMQFNNWSFLELYSDATCQQLYVLDAGDKILNSQDGGENWAACTPMETFSPNTLTLDPYGSPRIIVGTMGGGIFISTDGCQSWKKRNTGLGSLFVNAVAIDPNNTDTLYAGTDGGAYISFDGGQTWNEINDGLLGATVVYSIVVDKDSNVYAATPYGIFKLESR